MSLQERATLSSICCGDEYQTHLHHSCALHSTLHLQLNPHLSPETTHETASLLICLYNRGAVCFRRHIITGLRAAPRSSTFFSLLSSSCMILCRRGAFGPRRTATSSPPYNTTTARYEQAYTSHSMFISYRDVWF